MTNANGLPISRTTVICKDKRGDVAGTTITETFNNRTVVTEKDRRGDLVSATITLEETPAADRAKEERAAKAFSLYGFLQDPADITDEDISRLRDEELETRRQLMATDGWSKRGSAGLWVKSTPVSNSDRDQFSVEQIHAFILGYVIAAIIAGILLWAVQA